jgi:hypothetical protein
MNRYLVNNLARHGNGERFDRCLPGRDLFMPPIHQNEAYRVWNSPDDLPFSFLTSGTSEEETDPLPMKDWDDFLKRLGDVKDTVAACCHPGDFIGRRRSRPNTVGSSWTVQVLDQDFCAGETPCFKIFPSGSQACMVLEGAEIMESVEVLAAGDGEQDSAVFNVHMMHDDRVETMGREEALEFLIGVLQRMNGAKVGKKGLPTKDCCVERKRTQANSFLDENENSGSAAAFHRRNRKVRLPRFRRLFRKEKKKCQVRVDERGSIKFPC